MNESPRDIEGARGRGRVRAAVKRVFRRVGGPFVGYFDHRFRDLHERLDAPPTLDQLAATVEQRFAELRRELHQTRQDVADDADTVAELAFTLERFADHFTARMEELAAGFRRDEPASDSSMIELPFAYAAAAEIEAGAIVATMGTGTALPSGLSALGLRVTAIGGNPRLDQHPDIALVEGDTDRWAGPGEPLRAIFALSETWTSSRSLSPAMLDLFRKWLRPGGFLVLGLRRGATSDLTSLHELLADWTLEREERFAPITETVWQRRGARDTDPALSGVVLVKAVPRA